MQSSGRNCSPPPDSMLFKLILPGVFFSGGVFCSQAPVTRRDVWGNVRWMDAGVYMPTCTVCGMFMSTYSSQLLVSVDLWHLSPQHCCIVKSTDALCCDSIRTGVGLLSYSSHGDASCNACLLFLHTAPEPDSISAKVDVAVWSRVFFSTLRRGRV